MKFIPASDLVLRFFAEARSAVELAKPEIDIDAADIVKIAHDPVARGLFRDMFRGLNDPDIKLLIDDYLADVTHDLAGASERGDIKVDLIDRVAMAPSVAITVAGIVGLTGVALAAAASAPFLLAGGILGLTISGISRTLLRTHALNVKMDGRKVSQLKDSLP